jgi:hypothetical protein
MVKLSAFKLFAKSGDEVLLGAGKSIDEVADAIKGAKINNTGSISLPAGKRARGPDGKLISTKNNTYSKWDDSWEVIDNNILSAVKSTRNVDIAKQSFQIPIPGAKTSFNLGVFAVVGGLAYQILSTFGAVSDGLMETINNFFGNCDDKEGEEKEKCETNGARNQTILGIGLAGVGLLSLASFLGLGKKKEKVVVEA